MFSIESGPGLPLQHTHFLSSDAGSGRGGVAFLPCDRGVLVLRRGFFALYDHELRRQLWQVEAGGSNFIYTGGSVLCGPGDQGEVIEIDPSNGRVIRRKQVGPGLVKGFTDSVLLLFVPVPGQPPKSILRAIDRGRLSVLWETDWFGWVTAQGETCLVDDCRATILRSVESRTGNVLWSYSVPGDTQIVAGFPGVVALGDRVIVVLMSGKVVSLSLASGEVLGEGQGEPSPIHLVTETAIFYLRPDALIEFDHRSMKQVSRLEWGNQLEEIGGQSYPCGFWLSEEAVIWTSLDGRIIGVPRKVQGRGRRKVWLHRLKGALIPIAEFPLAYGNFLYVADKSVQGGLHCFTGDGVSPPQQQAVRRNAKRGR